MWVASIALVSAPLAFVTKNREAAPPAPADFRFTFALAIVFPWAISYP